MSSPIHEGLHLCRFYLCVINSLLCWKSQGIWDQSKHDILRNQRLEERMGRCNLLACNLYAWKIYVLLTNYKSNEYYGYKALHWKTRYCSKTSWVFGKKCAFLMLEHLVIRRNPLPSLLWLSIRITSDKKPMVMYIPITKHLPSKISSNYCRELTDVLSTVFPKELPFIWVILVTVCHALCLVILKPKSLVSKKSSKCGSAVQGYRESFRNTQGNYFAVITC